MNRFKKYMLLLVMSVSMCGITLGQTNTATPAASQPDKFVEITISGAAEPVPALQYRLLPMVTDQKPGNAAIDWFKLTASMPTDDIIRMRLSLKEGDPDCSELLDMPFAKFKSEYLDYADKYYKVSTWDFLKHAALSESCDWQDHFEDGMDMVLPSLSDLKRIARYVALEVRVEIARGNYNRALELLSYNFALAEDVGKGKTLIQNLVGIGIAALSYEMLEDFVSQSDAPNLYWALELMPDKLIDMRQAYESEMNLWFKGYIDGLENDILSVEQANKIFMDMFQLTDVSTGTIDSVGLAAFVGMNYVPAKKQLHEIGYDQSRIELMPATQVVLLAMWKEYVPLRDNVFKYLFLPYYQGHDLLAKQEKELAVISSSHSIKNIFIDILPAVSKASLLRDSLQVRGDTLQCVEAIRMYVAAYGKLPENLSDIKYAPTPINAFTGKPLKYYLEGEVGVLDVEDPKGRNRFSGYKISLRR